MSIRTPLACSLEINLNVFLQILEFESPIEDPGLQVNPLIETSSAKIKTQNRVAIEHLIDTISLRFFGLVRRFFWRTPG